MRRDQEIFDLIEQEHQRQLKGMELIASENFVSDEVMNAMGSYLTNKYAEGYPGKRYYGGCQVVDKVENLAIDRVKQLSVALSTRRVFSTTTSAITSAARRAAWTTTRWRSWPWRTSRS